MCSWVRWRGNPTICTQAKFQYAIQIQQVHSLSHLFLGQGTGKSNTLYSSSIDVKRPFDTTKSVDMARFVDAAWPFNTVTPGCTTKSVNGTMSVDAARSINTARLVDATRPVDAAILVIAESSVPRNDHLPPSPTHIPQLNREALEPEPEPVLQLRQRYKMGDRKWVQRDIDHPTLCVICDVQVYNDRDARNLM